MALSTVMQRKERSGDLRHAGEGRTDSPSPPSWERSAFLSACMEEGGGEGAWVLALWSYPGSADSVALDIFDVPASAGSKCCSGASHWPSGRMISSFPCAAIRAA